MAKKTANSATMTEENIYKSVSKSVKTLMDFTKEKTVMNIVSSVNSGNIAIDATDLQKLTALVSTSIDQSLTAGFSSVEHSIKEISKNR
jgi:hypothetical protein